MTLLLLLLLIGTVIALVVMRSQITESRRHAVMAAQSIAQLQQQLIEVTQQHGAQLDSRAGRAVAASRGSFNGHVAQQAFPYASGHAYHPKDIFHFGGVVDYIVFDGLYNIRHNGGDPQALAVVLADVKWGASRPSDVQRAVMDAMAGGRVRGEVWQARESAAGELGYQRTIP